MGPVRSLEAALRGTTRVLFKRKGETHVIDLGNTMKLTHAPDIQRVEHKISQVGDAGRGWVRGISNQLHGLSDKFTFTASDWTDDTLRLLHLGGLAVANNQAANLARAVAITDVEKGRTYDLGGTGLTGHNLTFGGATKTEGVDFTIDYASGLLTILSGGTIVSGTDDVAGTIALPAQNFKRVTGATEVQTTGSLKVEVWDSGSDKHPRRIINCSDVEVYITSRGDVEPGKFNEWTGEIYLRRNPTIDERVDATV